VVDSFSPTRREAAMLKEGVSHHGHQRVAVKPPESSLEVIKTEFLFHLLVGLFAHPGGLDGCGAVRSVAAGRRRFGCEGPRTRWHPPLGSVRQLSSVQIASVRMVSAEIDSTR
jgi:hypothetical protein